MTGLFQDFRFAIRQLLKKPGFASTALLTLALGIGANVAIFSVVNAVLLRPLPYGDADRLVNINQVPAGDRSGAGLLVSYTKFSQIKEQSHSLEDAAAYYATNLSLLTKREPEQVPAAHATPNLFSVLGTTPAQGRNFLPEEDQPSGSDVVLITDSFWHNHFGGDPQVIGQTLALDGRSVTVVGILPSSFRFPLLYPEPQVWLPRIFETNLLSPAQVHSGASYLGVVGRLRSGQSVTNAQAELDTINARYRQQFGGYVDASKFELSALSLQDFLIGPSKPSLLVLLAAVSFVLLIACANVAGLLLVRAVARQKEVAIRKALGASRLRLVRQLLSESLVLSLTGGTLGVFLALLLTPVLRLISPGTVPRLEQAQVDGSVLLFALFLCCATGIAFGLVPAVQISRRDLHDILKESGRGSSGSGGRSRFRSVLVVAEVAVALMLMTGAGLLIKSFARLMQVNPGIESRGLMTFPITLPSERYSQEQQQTQFYRQLLERVRAIPAVKSAAITSYLPLSGAVRFVFFCPEGRTCEGIGKDPVVAQRQVSTDYFSTVRTPLLRGRVFNDQDVVGSQPVVIVNQTIADRYWPNQDPIGKHLANSRDRIERVVVGVVAGVKFNTLNAPDVEEMYLPVDQSPWPAVTLIIRSESSSKPLIAAVREQLAQLDPSLPIAGIRSMQDVISLSVAQPRIVMQFVGIFAGMALALAAVGLYAVVAYSVTQRNHEMGIRMALGAQRQDILALVVRYGMGLTLVGVGLGIVASLALTRLLASLLFGIGATDPMTFSSAAALLMGTAVFACYLPARRATRVDPMVALRYE